jgi:hypothetical protein
MFISANVKAGTMYRFIQGTHKKVVARAKAVVAGERLCHLYFALIPSFSLADSTIVQDRTEEMRRKILAAALLIVVHGFIVLHWMIDKSRANLNALLKC